MATLDLVRMGEAEAVIGMHISAVRIALIAALRGRVPYVYTPVYEGGEQAPGVFMVGETPDLQLQPPIHWLAERRGARRWYLIGNDYVWPRVSHRAARRYVAAAGGTVVGEDYVAFGSEYQPCLDRIRAARPDVVLVSMVGGDCIAFNRAFAESGLARHILRLSMASEENTLLGIGADHAENLYFAAGYLANLKTAENISLFSIATTPRSVPRRRCPTRSANPVRGRPALRRHGRARRPSRRAVATRMLPKASAMTGRAATSRCAGGICARTSISPRRTDLNSRSSRTSRRRSRSEPIAFHCQCERSEAIQQLAQDWIASSLALLAMTSFVGSLRSDHAANPLRCSSSLRLMDATFSICAKAAFSVARTTG